MRPTIKILTNTVEYVKKSEPQNSIIGIGQTEMIYAKWPSVPDVKSAAMGTDSQRLPQGI